MDIQSLELQRVELERKLSARRNSPGSAENVRDIETALASLDTEIARQRAELPEGG